MLESLGGGGGAEKRDKLMESLHPWKSVPKQSDAGASAGASSWPLKGMSVEASGGVSVAYDNGCPLSYSLALLQQYSEAITTKPSPLSTNSATRLWTI